MDRWKRFRGRVERFSWSGGSIFILRWKENHGKIARIFEKRTGGYGGS